MFWTEIPRYLNENCMLYFSSKHKYMINIQSWCKQGVSVSLLVKYLVGLWQQSSVVNRCRRCLIILPWLGLLFVVWLSQIFFWGFPLAEEEVQRRRRRLSRSSQVDPGPLLGSLSGESEDLAKDCQSPEPNYAWDRKKREAQRLKCVKIYIPRRPRNLCYFFGEKSAGRK